MTVNDLLIWCARKGPTAGLRKSAFKRFSRRNAGKQMTVLCRDGFRMNTVIGDNVDRKIAVYGLFERDTTEIVSRLSSEVACFLDVGCNIGYFSCLFAARQPEKPLVALDPNPAMVERTTQNLELNHASNWEVLTCGIGEATGTLTLNIPRQRHSLSSFAYAATRGGVNDGVQARIRTLDEILAEHDLQDSLVKIDTEGFECKVFRGLSRGLAETIRFAICELSSSHMQQAGDTVEQMLSLPAMGAFDIHLIKEEDEVVLERTRPEDLRARDTVKENVLLVRKDIPWAAVAGRTGLHCR